MHGKHLKYILQVHSKINTDYPIRNYELVQEMNSGILLFLISFVKYITFCPTNIHHWCMFLISHSQFY